MTNPTTPNGKPTVLVIGGPDVDARIELIQMLRDRYDLSAAGTENLLYPVFEKVNIEYYVYSQSRHVNPLADLRTVRSLIHLFRVRKPALVHTFDTKPCVLARIAAKLAGVPVVVGTIPGLGSLYAESNLGFNMVRSLYEKLQKVACNLSDLTIFQNRDDARFFATKKIVSEQKVTVIPGSGVSTDVFDAGKFTAVEKKETREVLGIAGNDLVVTMVSRVIRTKGVAEFADAAEIVRRRISHVKFLLAGAEDKESLDRFTPEELTDIARKVNWLGQRNDVSNILAISDIFVLPSFYREGIPRVLLEAASMGLPIITTDAPGCNEIVVHGENGFLVSPHAPEELAEAILQLLRNPGLRAQFGAVSRARAVNEYELSKVAEKTSEVYRDLLVRKGVAVVT